MDLAALEKLLNSLREEMDGKYFSKEEGDRLKERTDGIDKRSLENEKEIDALKRLLKEKVDCDAFDEEIALLKQMIGNMVPGEAKAAPAPTGPSISSKELNHIREMIAKIPGIEESLAKILKDLKHLDLGEIREQLKALAKEVDQKTDKSESARMQTELDALRDLLDKLRREFEVLKSSKGSGGDVVIQVTNRIEKLEVRLEGLEKELRELLRKMQQPQTMDFPQEQRGGVDEETFRALERRVDALENEFNAFRNEIAKILKDLQDQINQKADLEALAELEKSLMNKLDEVVKALIKQLADKNDTKKALKALEKQLKNLYELIMNRQNNPDEDDAMFAKKPLGGWSCASCEKNLINLQGQTADYYPWNRFPVRDPQERIARVGQGFSRMLSMIKPENIQKFGPDEEVADTVPDPSKQPPRTMQNFYQGGEDYQKRPVSAQVLPGIRKKERK